MFVPGPDVAKPGEGDLERGKAFSATRETDTSVDEAPEEAGKEFRPMNCSCPDTDFVHEWACEQPRYTWEGNLVKCTSIARNNER